jgi:hypothetical protein
MCVCMERGCVACARVVYKAEGPSKLHKHIVYPELLEIQSGAAPLPRPPAEQRRAERQVGRKAHRHMFGCTH